MPSFWRKRYEKKETAEDQPATEGVAPNSTIDTNQLLPEQNARSSSPALTERSMSITRFLSMPHSRGDPTPQNVEGMQDLHLGPEDLQALMASVRLQRQELAELQRTLQQERDDIARERESWRQKAATDREQQQEYFNDCLSHIQEHLLGNPPPTSEASHSESQNHNAEDLEKLQKELGRLRDRIARVDQRHPTPTFLDARFEHLKEATEDRILNLEKCVGALNVNFETLDDHFKALKKDVEHAEQSVMDLAESIKQGATPAHEKLDAHERQQAVASPSTAERLRQQRPRQGLFSWEEHTSQHAPFNRYIESCDWCFRDAGWSRQY